MITAGGACSASLTRSNRWCLWPGSADTTAKIWHLRDGYASEHVAVLDGHTDELYGCEWLRDADQTVFTASGRNIALWDISKQHEIALVKLQSSSVHSEFPTSMHTEKGSVMSLGLLLLLLAQHGLYVLNFPLVDLAPIQSLWDT